MIDDRSDEREWAWCAEQRQQVIAHFHDEGLAIPAVEELPVWHVAPIVSVWAVEDASDTSRRWWAISGDLPTDHIVREPKSSPRQALHDIGLRWRDGAAKWAKGQSAEGWGLRNRDKEKELAPLLAVRAELFLDIAADDSNWEDAPSA
jgi:hypothetical protein